MTSKNVSALIRIGQEMITAVDLLANKASRNRSDMICHAIANHLCYVMDDDVKHSIRLFREVYISQGLDMYVTVSKLFIKWQKAVNGEKGYKFVLYDLGEKRKFWLVQGPEDTPAVIQTWKEKMFTYIRNLEKLGIFEEKRGTYEN